MYCPKCGSESEGGRFCRSCGTNLVAVSDALTASDQSRGVTARHRGTTVGIFNSPKLTNAEQSLDGHSTASIFGSVKIDLTAADLPVGEIHLHVYSLFGSVDILVLDNVGVRITGLSMFSAVKVRDTDLGNGMFSVNEYISPGYADAAQRVHIDATSIFSALKLRR